MSRKQGVELDWLEVLVNMYDIGKIGGFELVSWIGLGTWYAYDCGMVVWILEVRTWIAYLDDSVYL